MVALPGSPDLTTLKDRSGRSWVEYRRTLTPRYGQVWAGIAVRSAMLVAFGLVSVWLARRGWTTALLVSVPIGAVWCTVFIGALGSYLHEAVHFNLHPNPRWNDLIANVFLSPLVGLEVAKFRRSHWMHHLHLGTPDDTEISYHRPLTRASIISDLFGATLFRLLNRYFFEVKDRSVAHGAGASPLGSKAFLGLSLLFHAAVVVALAWGASPWTAAAWILAVVIGVPMLSRIKNTLEHRSEFARPDVDYAAHPHGPTNRLFGTDSLSVIIGSAGFNRHLLHHWDPSVSYTRFDDMETFLADSSVAPLMRSRQVTYFSALRSFLVNG